MEKDPGRSPRGRRAPVVLRRLAGIGLIVVAAMGSLLADVGFSDGAIARGVHGLWFWVPSVALAVLGVRLAARGLSRVARVAVAVVAAALPLLVLVFWFWGPA